MTYHLKSALPTYQLYKKTIFLRSDLNVPINKEGVIESCFKLEASMQTIDFIIKNGGNILLATHLGSYETAPLYSTKLLLPWFVKKGINITFCATIDDHMMAIKKNEGHVFLLENLRHYSAEKELDRSFAQKLKKLTDYYINDAFAAMHRNYTSLTLLATLFSPENRTIGFLVEKELTHLNKLLLKPEKPFLAILGGGKITTKLPLIKNLLTKADAIALCPALVFTFLKAIGKEIGTSLHDDSALTLAKNIIATAKKKTNLIFPLDYQIELADAHKTLLYCDVNSFPKQARGIAIGKKSITLFEAYINQAKTIFFNGPMGFFDREETLQASKDILTMIAESNAFKVIGGGDSIALLEHYGLTEHMSFVSTGGGATLRYLSGLKLPGLQALTRNL